MNKSQISQIAKNAKIDRLHLLYIDLTEILKGIDHRKESFKNDQQSYRFYSGISLGIFMSLSLIEKQLKELGAFN